LKSFDSILSILSKNLSSLYSRSSIFTFRCCNCLFSSKEDDEVIEGVECAGSELNELLKKDASGLEEFDWFGWGGFDSWDVCDWDERSTKSSFSEEFLRIPRFCKSVKSIISGSFFLNKPIEFFKLNFYLNIRFLEVFKKV